MRKLTDLFQSPLQKSMPQNVTSMPSVNVLQKNTLKDSIFSRSRLAHVVPVAVMGHF